jgi:hypothetical protein
MRLAEKIGLERVKVLAFKKVVQSDVKNCMIGILSQPLMGPTL